MYPETLLKQISWSFSDTTYESLDDFIAAVSAYHTSLELSADWNAAAIAIEARQVTVVVAEVYDQNEEEVDLTIDLTASAPAFTNGELLFMLHNAIAEKMRAGYDLGDHCFFEGLNYDDGTDGQYYCYLGG